MRTNEWMWKMFNYAETLILTCRPVFRLCNSRLEEIRFVTYSVSAAVPAPQQLK